MKHYFIFILIRYHFRLVLNTAAVFCLEVRNIRLQSCNIRFIIKETSAKFPKSYSDISFELKLRFDI